MAGDSSHQETKCFVYWMPWPTYHHQSKPSHTLLPVWFGNRVLHQGSSIIACCSHNKLKHGKYVPNYVIMRLLSFVVSNQGQGWYWFMWYLPNHCYTPYPSVPPQACMHLGRSYANCSLPFLHSPLIRIKKRKRRLHVDERVCGPRDYFSAI